MLKEGNQVLPQITDSSACCLPNRPGYCYGPSDLDVQQSPITFIWTVSFPHIYSIIHSSVAGLAPGWYLWETTLVPAGQTRQGRQDKKTELGKKYQRCGISEIMPGLTERKLSSYTSNAWYDSFLKAHTGSTPTSRSFPKSFETIWCCFLFFSPCICEWGCKSTVTKPAGRNVKNWAFHGLSHWHSL